MSGAYKYRPQYTQNELGPAPESEQQFCRYCGAGIGQYRRKDEGTCEKCNPEGAK